MTDSELLCATATALYGERWQNALARAIGVADRTVRRWAAGEAPVPLGVWADIQEIIADRLIELADLQSKFPH